MLDLDAATPSSLVTVRSTPAMRPTNTRMPEKRTPAAKLKPDMMEEIKMTPDIDDVRHDGAGGDQDDSGHDHMRNLAAKIMPVAKMTGYKDAGGQDDVP